MKHLREAPRNGRLLPVAAAAVVETIYLAILCFRNVSGFRAGGGAWAHDLARESGMAGVSWLALASGVLAATVALLARRRFLALVWVVAVLVGCLVLESVAFVERIGFERMGHSMTNLRDAGLIILKTSNSSTSGLPVELPPEIVAERVFHDGWGHPLRYVRMSPSHAFLIAPGSDGRIEANAATIKREEFPPSRFDHDTIVDIGEGNVDFVVHAYGPEMGIPCTIYAAFGCLSYWR